MFNESWKSATMRACTAWHLADAADQDLSPLRGLLNVYQPSSITACSEAQHLYPLLLLLMDKPQDEMTRPEYERPDAVPDATAPELSLNQRELWALRKQSRPNKCLLDEQTFSSWVSDLLATRVPGELC